MLRRWTLLAAALWAALSAPPAFASPPLKVYVSADMEGVAGVVSSDQLGPTSFEYERFRTFMTNEVLAAIEGARAAGATEFVVSDSHGNAENLLIDKFPKDVQIVRGFPRPLAMMEGIDGGFGAVLFVGYHASTTNPAGVRAHTMSSANLADVRIQGVSVPEAGFNAAIAGHFGVPIAMITGDDVIVKEAQALLGPIEGVAVKQALGFHSAKTLTPEASCDACESCNGAGACAIGPVTGCKMPIESVRSKLMMKNRTPDDGGTRRYCTRVESSKRTPGPPCTSVLVRSPCGAP